ncbi:MAG: DUF1501 domain-containing protein [Pirellulaceae bacterium]
MTRQANNISRRSFLGVGCAGAAGLSLPLGLGSLLAAETEKRRADAVLFINLAGGPSHLETLDMKPAGPADTRGSFGHVQSKIPGLVVSEYMPKYAARADRYTLVRGISHSTGDHPQGQQYLATGNRPTPALQFPAIGSIVSRVYPGEGEIPPFVAIPECDWHAGYMGDAYAPFKTNATPKKGEPFEVRGITLPEGLTVSKVRRRNQLLKDLDGRFAGSQNNRNLTGALKSLGEQAESMILSSRTRDAFDVSKEPESIQSLFADNDLGQGLLLATRLIEFGAPFVTMTHKGWDTHLDNFTQHKELVPAFDNGLDAVVSAFQQKGLLDRTLVIAMGEFGRTPKINKDRGRDHFPRNNFCVMAGAGTHQGLLLGGSDASGSGPDDQTEIKPDEIAATILQAVGIDHHKEYYTNTGRPVTLVANGRVLNEVFD